MPITRAKFPTYPEYMVKKPSKWDNTKLSLQASSTRVNDLIVRLERANANADPAFHLLVLPLIQKAVHIKNELNAIVSAMEEIEKEQPK